ncbi:MAG: serine hydroxymethyltransferase, partial [Candidatus Heimdallarchaeota archaeon]|nr:serine hydroxymethyltransferase [Candidatus Heimdallarchaeota archaeon]
KLFNAPHVNVQPHCGSSANMGVYFAMLKPKDKLMGLHLFHGGHLTHGFKTSFSAKLFHSFPYELDKETELLDYNEILKQAKFVKPKLIVSGATAYPRLIDFKQFKEIADEVGALLMADIAHIAGLVAAKEHPDPAPYCDVITTTTHKTLRGPRGAIIMGKTEFELPINKAVFPGMQGGPLDHVVAGKAICFKEALQPEFKDYARQIKANAKALASSLMDNGSKLISKGTDNHLILIDISPYELGGKIAERELDGVGIFTNKNVIPNETRSPFDPSGIRLGTAALTTRGLGTSEMSEIGELIPKTLGNIGNLDVIASVKSSVEAICSQYPLYPGFELLRG